MSDAANAHNLHNWAVNNGCSFDNLRIAQHPSYDGFGLFNSSQTTAENDDKRRALFVPNSLIISIDLISGAADESEELADVLNALPELPTLEPIITVFLLYQLYLARSGKPSKWQPYLDSLPRRTFLPITWNEDELKLLRHQNTSISKAVPAKLAFLRSIFSALQQVPGWFQSIKWEEYILGESWVSSRTIQDPRTETPILVPILDMANHSATRNAAWEVVDEGIELRREPVDINADDELTISYDLDRGTGERLHRYGFVEDTTPGTCSKAIALLADIPAVVPGGSVFRLRHQDLEHCFTDLSFMTYENWLTILPIEDDTDSSQSVHKLCPPSEDDPTIKIKVHGPQQEAEILEAPDLESLLIALHHAGTFHFARQHALKIISEIMKHYKENMHCLATEDYTSENYQNVSREVRDLIELCCKQEKALLDYASKISHDQIDKLP